jgi:dual specificity phosphatase 12
MFLFIVLLVSYRVSSQSSIDSLVFPSLGVSRSATIACMWLMRRHKLSANAALKRLRLARPVIRPNPSFAAQLYLYEQMNHQFDTNHGLYKEFQFERARALYIDHDTESEGIDKKNNLRQQFRHAFTLPYGHATCTVTGTYTCRQCHTELFTNADLFRHSEGLGLYDWFMKYGNDKFMQASSEVECHQQLFTNYLEWLMAQIDTPENTHSGSMKCPNCSTIVGNYNLNGDKCSCGRWIIPGFHFDTDKIEQKATTKMNIETKTISSSS